MYTKYKSFKLKDKILITGGNGFVGKNLIKILKKRKIIVFTRKNIINKRNIKYIKVDIFNKKKIKEIISIEKPKILIHLAWETEPKKYLNKISNLKWLHASNHLLNEFCKNGGRRAILIGSGLELNFNNNLLREEQQNLSENQNLNYYNISKILFHFNAIRITNNYKINMTWARIFWLYGENEKNNRLVPYLINSFKNKKKIIIQNKGNKINILNVKDVVNIIKKLINKKNISIINIANNKNHTLKSIILIIMKNLNIKSYKKIVFKKDNKNNNNYKVSTNSIDKINYKYIFSLNNGIKKLIEYMK